MAILNVAQFAYLAEDSNGNHCQAAKGYLGAEDVDFTAGETDSSAVDEDCYLVRVISDTDCHISFGTAPTATTSDLMLPANTIEYFGLGSGMKVSVIAD